VTSFSVRNVLMVCGALFVLALGFLILADGRDAAAVLNAFWSRSPVSKLAWAVIVLVPLFLIPAAVWLGQTLVRQRLAAQALQLRLDGVRQGVNALVKPHAQAEAAVAHLAHTDPEDTINAMRQRLSEAERFTQIQNERNEIDDLASRAEAIRAQQKALQGRLAPALEKRRSIERHFADLDSRQNDVERALAEILSGGDAVALDINLKKMMDFVRHSYERCDDIERASKTLAGLQEDYGTLQARLAPDAAVDDGGVRRVKELSAAGDQLAREIGSLEQTPQGPLAGRVQKLADERKSLDDRISLLDAELAKLATLRHDVAAFDRFDRALDVLSEAPKTDGAVDVDTRVEELATFIEGTQAHLDEIERRAIAFSQLKTKLGELQFRLALLEAENGGVANLVDELRQMRDRLFARIQQIEEDDDGGLAERVKRFSETGGSWRIASPVLPSNSPSWRRFAGTSPDCLTRSAVR
jgi:DNA repair exonuclease SbcCD ATPase subunit